MLNTGAAEGKDTAWKDPAQLRPETVTKEEVQNQTRNRRLLWLIPIPGTSTSGKKARRQERLQASSVIGALIQMESLKRCGGSPEPHIIHLAELSLRPALTLRLAG
jgi:hypothetical protein